MGNPGTLRLVVKPRRHAAQQVAFRAKDRTIQVVSWRRRRGLQGHARAAAPARSSPRSTSPRPVTGYFDSATARAVTAFRKTNGMGTTGYADGTVYHKLFRGQGAFKLALPEAGKKGKHVEFDWSRQVLVLAKEGRPYRIYHSSSGKAVHAHGLREVQLLPPDAGHELHGMVDSSYFIGGYAIHGYAYVPNYPASHGCLRVPIPNARQIFDWVDIGDPIFVYRKRGPVLARSPIGLRSSLGARSLPNPDLPLAGGLPSGGSMGGARFRAPRRNP